MNKPDPAVVFRQLKDFQRKTANAAFSRLYTDPDAVDRFLVADEVGLGKTLVAKAVIAQAVEHLWDTVERIDVVYVCSNADIARQNIGRLRIDKAEGFTEASRLTLLPLYARGLTGKKVNFVSLTPSTSLDLRGSQGAWRERALLFNILQDAWDIKHIGAKRVLQGNVREWWIEHLRDFMAGYEHRDETLIEQIVAAFAKKHELRDRYDELADRSKGGVRKADHDERRELVGELRRVLAKECLDKLEPDLVILDEFQRFKDLLDPDNEGADLAQALFEYRSATTAQERARILLLSATPYKMYTRAGEGEDHHEDFLRTVRFLLQDDAQLGQFKIALREFREALTDGDPAATRLHDAKRTIERILRRVMCRTERLGVSPNRDGMIKEIIADQLELHPDDIDSYAALDRVARATDSGDTVEIWKSAPLPLGLMDHHYALKRKVGEHLPYDPLVRDPLLASSASLVPAKAIEDYQPLQPTHARTREIARQTISAGAWRLLWVPPSLPYWRGSGAYAEDQLRHFTKRLLFSAWKVAPKAVAGVLSYESERHMVAGRKELPPYSELYTKVRPILRFAESEGRLTGMSFLTLMYPSIAWATHFDPLKIALDLGGTPSGAEVLRKIEEQLEAQLAAHINQAPTSGPTDQSWYWAAPLLFEHPYKAVLRPWLHGEDSAGAKNDWSWSTHRDGDSEDSHFGRHVERVREFFDEPRQLGRPPDDLISVLAKIIVASPAVVALRALMRFATPDGPTIEHLGAAAWIAMGFRSLFNLPETMLYLRASDDERYWERVLDEAIAGNLQSVIDEYAHVLHESLGETSPYAIAEEMETAVALRTSKIEYDDLAAMIATKAAQAPSGSIRCRFALRFGDGKTHDDEDQRQGAVRTAFNSPFRPFVLASTSVGQEGLDFHTYCHAIMHWNLPSNPVDFEQREGRVHRYKGHFVRKNLAARYGLAGMRTDGTSNSSDPWARLFERAARDRPDGATELNPYWIFEGEHLIERHIPILPLSRERMRYDELKSALALYRLVFGQPRQEELLRLLGERFIGTDATVLLDQRIDLQPR